MCQCVRWQAYSKERSNGPPVVSLAQHDRWVRLLYFSTGIVACVHGPHESRREGKEELHNGRWVNRSLKDQYNGREVRLKVV